MNNIK